MNGQIVKLSVALYLLAVLNLVALMPSIVSLELSLKNLPLAGFVLTPSMLLVCWFLRRLGLDHLQIITLVLLGCLFSLGPSLVLAGVYSVPLPMLAYMASVSIAHLAEWLFVSVFHCTELEWDSFLIN